MPVCRFVFLICLGCTSATTACAQSVPESVSGVSAIELSKLVELAGAQNLIIDDLLARVSGNRIVFNAQFTKNADNVQWLVQLNLSNAQLNLFEKENGPKGFERAVETSVRVAGRQLHSVIWVLPKTEAVPLVLPKGPVPVTGLEDSRLKPIGEMMVAFLAEHNAAGATLAIAKDDRLVYSRGFGYADVSAKQAMQPNSEMRLASVSKSITGVAVMMLVDKGLLSLDAKVLPLLLKDKSFRFKPNGNQRWNDVTILNLLQHTGGWNRSVGKDPMFDVVNVTRQLKLRKTASAKDILKYQLTQPLDFDPGQKYAYSNFGYSILGRVVEGVMGEPFGECVRELILAPRSMKSTRLGKIRLEDRGDNEAYYHMQSLRKHLPFWTVLNKVKRGRLKVQDSVPEPYGRWDLEVMDSCGGWVSTAPDLLRFITGLAVEDVPLLSDAAIAQTLAKPQLKEPEANSWWYGCGWTVRAVGRGDRLLDRHSIWHSGGLAGTSTLLVRRRDGFSWAILFNTDNSKNGERLSGLIDSPIHRAVDTVEFWPDYDLFEKQ